MDKKIAKAIIDVCGISPIDELLDKYFKSINSFGEYTPKGETGVKEQAWRKALATDIGEYLVTGYRMAKIALEGIKEESVEGEYKQMESSIITVARMLEPEIKAYKDAQENIYNLYRERKTHNVDYSSYFSPVVQENISKKEFRKAQQQLAEAFMLLLAGAEAGAKL